MTTLNDKLYGVWQAMHRRCYNKAYHSYHRYGGRGIVVCERWHTYANFKADMGHAYSPGLSVDRINNDDPYELNNCRWLPKTENRKPFKVDPQKLLAEYNAGALQKELAVKYSIDQPHVSKLLKRARRGETFL